MAKSTFRVRLPFRCDIDGCGAQFRLARLLGSHKRLIHGIVGTSKSALWRAAKNGDRDPTPAKRRPAVLVTRATRTTRAVLSVSLSEAIAVLQAEVDARLEVIHRLKLMEGDSNK